MVRRTVTRDGRQHVQTYHEAGSGVDAGRRAGLAGQAERIAGILDVPADDIRVDPDTGDVTLTAAQAEMLAGAAEHDPVEDAERRAADRAVGRMTERLVGRGMSPGEARRRAEGAAARNRERLVELRAERGR